MMPARLVADLRRRDVWLSVNADRLVVNAPTGVITPDLKEELRLHKAEVVAFLSRPKRQMNVKARKGGAPPAGVVYDDGIQGTT